MGSGAKAKKQTSNNEYITGTLRLAPNRKFYSEGVEFEVTGTHYDGRIYFCDVKNLNTGISKQVNWDKLYAILEQIHRSTQGGGRKLPKIDAPENTQAKLF